jgi:hypothetical protein
MPDSYSRVAPAIDPLLETLRADGAELEYLDSSSAIEIVFRLDLTHAQCAECVLPKEQLESVLLFAVQKAIPGIRSVTVEDPRVVGSSAGASGAC